MSRKEMNNPEDFGPSEILLTAATVPVLSPVHATTPEPAILYGSFNSIAASPPFAMQVMVEVSKGGPPSPSFNEPGTLAHENGAGTDILGGAVKRDDTDDTLYSNSMPSPNQTRIQRIISRGLNYSTAMLDGLALATP